MKNKGFITLINNYHYFQEMGKSFLQWLNEKVEKKHIAVEDIRPQFPTIWSRFLFEKNLTDNFEDDEEEELGG